MIRRLRTRRGVSVLEGVIASSLLTLVLLGVLGLNMHSGQAWSYGTARLGADDRGSLALQALSQDMRGGSRATVDSTGSVLTVTSAVANSAGDFDRTATASETTRYFVTGTNLYKQQGSSPAVQLGSQIKQVRFAVSGSRVTIALTSRQQSGTKVREADFNTEITLRNPPVE